MKFGVDKIEYENDKIIVTGTTEIGKFKGVWKYREQPVVKYTYFIEVSYEKFEKKISQSPAYNFSTSICDDMVVFNCQVEDIDEDVYYVRFAADWLDMVEIESNCVLLDKGSFASFTVRYEDIWIYPYD
ncbi:MAG: hypothetical protein HFI18_11760 [Lachnospiraceae bacterium]|jgi:hypothetical protein|nr:hypothetical protein [Lachnospiraceae bacterium]